MDRLDAFVAACEAQQIGLDSTLVDDCFDARKRGGVTIGPEPDGIYTAIVIASNQFGEHGEPLADRPIEPFPDSHDPLNRHPACRALATVINATVEPVQPKPTDVVWGPADAEPLETCGDAEAHFCEIVAGMQHLRQRMSEGVLVGWTAAGFRILRDMKTRQAIAITKGIGLGSTLTLTRTILDGVPYPAGSLLHVQAVDDFNEKEGEYELYRTVASWTCEVVNTDAVEHVRFLRLSALAVPPVLRYREFWPLMRDVEFGPRGAKLLASMRIEHARFTAQYIMDAMLAVRS